MNILHAANLRHGIDGLLYYTRAEYLFALKNPKVRGVL